MNRRLFLRALGTGAVGIAGGCDFSLEDGIFNPCLSDPIPKHLLNDELVQAAWREVDPAQFWDCHVHIAGVGDGNTGVWITPRMNSLFHPWQSLQRRFYLNASCTEREGSVDQDFVRRLLRYLEVFPRAAKAMLLAFDFHYDEQGARQEDLSSFFIPNRYAVQLAQRFPDRLEWICSIHPYRADAIEELDWCAGQGARAVKWLPSAMGMDPASPKCDRFYQALARLNLPLLSHAGEEQAVSGGSVEELNNPLRLRRPLDQGVRVIVAHCASLGEDIDIDRGANGPRLAGFELFERLMGESRYERQLFGEISAVIQANRIDPALAALIRRVEWHPRLINGSDYPLPGVVPIISLRRFVQQRFLTEAQAQVLSAIRRYNALLFDFVLKRNLVSGGQRFSPVVFESRRLFEPKSSAPS
jgi:predicted TIM-barrel fold metal-dependent hydrolase